MFAQQQEFEVIISAYTAKVLKFLTVMVVMVGRRPSFGGLANEAYWRGGDLLVVDTTKHESAFSMRY